MTFPDRAALPRMLVTGASGLLGANFCFAARDEYRISACSMRHVLQAEHIEGRRLDLRDGAQVVSTLDHIQPEIIVHFAAATDVNRCEIHPEEAVALNVVATEHLAGWAGRRGARFLLMSTDGVFDGLKGGYTEADTPAPVNYYAKTKLHSEHVVMSKVTEHLIVRASIYGWNAQPKCSLAEWVLAKLEAGQRVPGFTDVFFAPLLANTLAEIMLTLLRQTRQGLYHAASLDFISKHAFALAVAKEFSQPMDLIERTTLAATPQAARRPLNSSLDARKLVTDTGFVLPTVQQDIRRLRMLREAGFHWQLQAACHSFPHE